MNPRVALLALLAACPLAHTAEPVRGDFAYAMPLDADGTAALYGLALPTDVYRHAASASLADLRVLNGRGEVVPYALQRHAPQAGTPAAAYEPVPMFPLRGDDAQLARGLNLSIRTDGGALDLRSSPKAAAHERVRGYLLDLHALARAPSGIEVQWPDGTRDFSDAVTVEASDDLAQWRPVTRASLVNLSFNGQALRQQRIETPAVQAKYWRLMWDANREAVPLSAIRVALSAEKVQPARAQLAVTMGEAGDSSRPQREYLGDLGVQAPVDRVNVLLPERNSVVQAMVYARARPADAWRLVASGTFYRLANGDAAEVVNAALVVDPVRDRYWRIVVPGATSGLGGRAPRLEAGWIPEALRFVARGDAPFELVFGSAAAAPAETSLEMLDPTSGARQQAVQPQSTRAGPMVEAGGAA
ncbi:MAG: hypothetical protein RL684_3200, partial [Pseudomonadota bacterium]